MVLIQNKGPLHVIQLSCLGTEMVLNHSLKLPNGGSNVTHRMHLNKLRDLYCCRAELLPDLVASAH